MAQTGSFVQTVVPCGGRNTTTDGGTNNNDTGYVTIQAMNLDMAMELEQIRNGRPSQEPYIFVLCPDTVFEASVEPLRPLLSGSVFTCGVDGNVSLACELRGGTDQIVVDALTTNMTTNNNNYNLQSVNFIGLTHTGFTNSVVSGTATSTTTIDISRAIFQNFNARSVIHQSLNNETTTTTTSIAPFKVQISDCTIVNATGEYIFFNRGGELSIQDVTVSLSTLVSFVTTGSSSPSNTTTTINTEGSTFVRNVIVERSDIMDVFIVMQAADIDAMSITIREMTNLVSIFDIMGNGSTAVIENINIQSNNIAATNPTNLWIGIHVRDNAVGTVQFGTVVENTNFRHIFTASNSAVLDIQNLSVVGASGGRVVNERDISAGIFSNLQSMVTISNLIVDDTESFTSVYFAGFGSNLTIMNTCIGEGNNQGTVYISEESSFIANSNFIDPSFVTSVCGESGMRLIQELPGSGCFDVNRTDCDFNCTNFFDADSCMVQLVTLAPSITPTNMTLTPTIATNTTFRPTVASLPPSSVNVSQVPSQQPLTATKQPVNKTSSPVPRPTSMPMVLPPSFTATSSPMTDTFPTLQPNIMSVPSRLPQPTLRPLAIKPPTLFETQLPTSTMVPPTSKPACDCNSSKGYKSKKSMKDKMKRKGMGKGKGGASSVLSYFSDDDTYRTDDDNTMHETTDDDNNTDCICRESRKGKGMMTMGKSGKGKGKGDDDDIDDDFERHNSYTSSSSSSSSSYTSSSRVNHIFHYLEKNHDR